MEIALIIRIQEGLIKFSDTDYVDIPAGQFALILTHEKITIPRDAMGLISIRAKKKFEGLINVSGFHVDPGFSDNLIYSVFNAGPKSIPISKGDDIFLLWLADLDQPNKELKGSGGINGNISSDLIGKLNMEVASPGALSKKVDTYISLFKWVMPTLVFITPIVVGACAWVFLQVLDLKERAVLLEHELKIKSVQLQDTIEKLANQSDELTIFKANSLQFDGYLKNEKRLDNLESTIDSIDKKIEPLLPKKLNP